MTNPQLIFVDGNFGDLALEIAEYLQIAQDVKPLLEKKQDEEVLSLIVRASTQIHSVPEKEFAGAYNFLLHLVLQSQDPKKHLPTICGNLLKPSASPNYFTLASNALTTIFNLIDPKNSLRFNVFRQIVRFIKIHRRFDLLKPMLNNLNDWFKDWETDEEDQRALLLEMADAAAESENEDESYHLLVKTLATYDHEEDQEEIASKAAQQMSLRALKMAISCPTKFDFSDLRALGTIQALSESQPVYSQFLDIFTEQDLEDYEEFKEEHEGFIETEKFDNDVLERKMRLLTFASLAASTPNREIPYVEIAEALMIPISEVEMWTIDVIRAGLVEGRLSQKSKVFLVQRTTYRVFGEKQWRELSTRIGQCKSVVDKLLVVIRRQQAEAAAQKEREMQEIERKMVNVGVVSSGQGEGSDRRRGGQQQRQQKQRTMDDV